METQNKNNMNETTQITFKLTVEERQTIAETAEFSGLNLSEYCRMKCLADEKTVATQRNRINELEKQQKEDRVKLAYYKDSERDENSIVLQLDKPQHDVLEKLYKGFYSSRESLGKNIIEVLTHLAIEETLRSLVFIKSAVTIKEVEDAFYPEE